jgi:hypothetical protein
VLRLCKALSCDKHVVPINLERCVYVYRPSDGIVRLRTKATEFSLVLVYMYIIQEMANKLLNNFVDRLDRRQFK